MHMLKTLKRYLLASATALLVSGMPGMAHADGNWDIDNLMQALSQVRSGHASFVEKKSIAMLDQPVESSGELFYTAPDKLEKRTLKPKPETMLLDGSNITVERRGKKHVLQLQSYPEIAAFIDSIRGTMAGDRAALERNFKLSLEGSEQDWTLGLLPTNDKMKKVVQKLRMGGSGGELRSIAIHQADGDSSVMTITPLAVTPVTSAP